MAIKKVEPVSDSQFEVFSDIPLPEAGKRVKESKYPWDSLKVGQSFFVPDANPKTLYTLSYTRSKKGAAKFTAKAYTHNGTKGAMVWRTA